MTTYYVLPLVVLLTTLIGCDVPEIKPPTASPQPAAEVEQAPEKEHTSSEPEQNLANEEAVTDQRYNRNDPGAATTTPREATGFDGKKGKLSRREGGYLGTVLGSGMYAQHQAIFLQVKNAINIDYGLNGDFPKNQEEFDKRIIEFNNIKLPELSEGDEYIYDPEDHTLKVWSPNAPAEGAGATGPNAK